MFEDFTSQITDYVQSSGFLMDSIDLSGDTLGLWMQIAIGIVFELYAMQVFTALQLTKISSNNTQWLIDSLGHFCMDGKAIDADEHFYKSNFCVSTIYGKIVNGLVFAIKYHEGLIKDLANSVEYLHTFLGKPEQFFENMSIMEKEYREAIDIQKQMRTT